MKLNDGGTPDGPPADADKGGTAAGTKDGTGGRSPSLEDLKALEAAHRKNLEKERAAREAAERRISELEQRAMAAYAPPADPQLAMIRGLQERAPFDEVAAATLETMKSTTVQQLENRLLSEIISGGVPNDLVPAVQYHVRQSGYQMPIQDAMRLARGTRIDSVEAKLAEAAAENEKLKKELAAQKTRVPNMAMTPALEVDASAKSVPASQYNAILERGGAEAARLMQRTKLPKGHPEHIGIEFGA